MSTTIFTLPNGIRFIHRQNPSPVVYCGLTVNAGSRDEEHAENGMAHLVEHMLFKGTHRRTAYHINNRLENAGGELNAFTTKEETVIQATVLKSDIEKAVELMADMVFNATFPEKELIKEKEVIIDEINSCKDNPADLIFDEFDQQLFPHSPLGTPILGAPESIAGITREQIKQFVGKHYRTSQMVFSTIGKIPPARIARLATKYFSSFPPVANNYQRTSPAPCKPFQITKEENVFQAHCLIGNRAYANSHRQYIGLILLTNYLGGPAANSRLNTVLREKNGLVYTIEAAYNAYVDSGVTTIYFGTDKADVDRCLNLVYKDLAALRNRPLGTAQIHRIKKQLWGQLFIGSDNAESQVLSQAKSLLLYGEVESSEKLKARIDAVTAAQLQDIANEIFAPGHLSTLLYQ